MKDLLLSPMKFELIQVRTSFLRMTGMSYIYGVSPQEALLSRNPITTSKFRVVTLWREEAIAKSWPDEQKHYAKAYKRTSWPKIVKYLKATVTPNA